MDRRETNVNPVTLAKMQSDALDVLKEETALERAGKLQPLLQMMRIINSWEQEHLPVPPTQVGLDLFLRVASTCFDTEPKALKTLYWDSAHASSGLRKTLRQLESDGWLTRVPLPNDLRCRTLAATPALESLTARYLQMLSDVVTDATARLRESRLRPAPPPASAHTERGCWKLLIVDDEQDVHDITRLVLADFRFDGRPLQLLHAKSGAEAIRLFETHPDVAVALIDVVMETEDAGLRVVRHVREVLGNALVQLILRTGHPGLAPEREVIVEYDINDYKAKTELSSQKLYSMLVAALRAYRNSFALEQARRNLSVLMGASEAFQAASSPEQFARVLLEQVLMLLDVGRGALEENRCGALVAVDRAAEQQSGYVLGALGKYAPHLGTRLPDSAPELAQQLPHNLVCTADDSRVALRVGSSFGTSYHLLADIGRSLSPLDVEHLRLLLDKANSRLDIMFLAARNRAMQDRAMHMLAKLAYRGAGAQSAAQIERIEQHAARLAEAVVRHRLHPEQGKEHYVDFVEALSSVTEFAPDQGASAQDSAGGYTNEGGTPNVAALALRIMATAKLFGEVTDAALDDEPWTLEDALSQLDLLAASQADADLVALLLHGQDRSAAEPPSAASELRPERHPRR